MAIIFVGAGTNTNSGNSNSATSDSSTTTSNTWSSTTSGATTAPVNILPSSSGSSDPVTTADGTNHNRISKDN